MTTDQIVTIIVAIVGSGAFFATITAGINAIANRRKTGAESQSTAFNSLSTTANALTEVSKKQVLMLCEQMERQGKQMETQDKRIKELEDEVAKYRKEQQDRENIMEDLIHENRTLKTQMDKLIVDNKAKDKQIESLLDRVKELESRLTAAEKKAIS